MFGGFAFCGARVTSTMLVRNFPMLLGEAESAVKSFGRSRRSELSDATPTCID